MKKKILLLIALIPAGFALYMALQSSLKKPKEDRQLVSPFLAVEVGDTAYLKQLKDLGFTSLRSVKNMDYVKERTKWQKACGMRFLGDDEMQEFLRKNDFILGNANKYLEEIPKEAGLLIVANFKKAKDYEQSLPMIEEGMIFDGISWVGVEPDSEILIIAGASKFDTTGMSIEENILKAIVPRDPIAVYKVEKGYVELANWQ